MSKHVMKVSYFDVEILGQSDTGMICLNDVIRAGSIARIQAGKAPMQLDPFLNSLGVKEYVSAAALEWNLPEDSFVRKEGKGKYTKTYVHISIAILAAEQMSPKFHAFIHKTFIEGRLLEFRALGATEFTKLNLSIDQYLPEREGKDNKGVFIQSAKRIREKILGDKAKTSDWNSASVEQTGSRFDIENKICEYLKMGFVKNYDHLKELIDKI